MADMFSILTNACSPDNAIRVPAEQALMQYEEGNPADYFLALSAELRNDARQDGIRQFAATQMKRSLDAEDFVLRKVRQDRWKSIPEDRRKVIKDNVTSSIGAAGNLARLGAAQVISKIGYIEITPGSNGWPDLLPGLLAAAIRDDLPAEPRAAALTALAYLLEELDRYDACPIAQDQVDNTLTAICKGMQLASPQSLQQAAGRAMHNTLPFVASNFEEPARSGERDAIMLAICTASTSEDIRVKRTAFQCMERIATLYYHHLTAYMKVLADLTSTAARHPDETVASSALEFWAEVAEAEAELGENSPDNKKFTLQALLPLLEMLTDLMVSTAKESDDEDEDNDEYGVASAAQVCLRNVAGAVRNAVIDPIMRFINANFMSSEWQKREAAIMSFGLIMQGPDPKALQGRYIREVLPHLSARLVGGAQKDPNVQVRSAAAFTLAEIFEYHYDVLNPASEFLPAVQALCAALDDVPLVVNQVVRALDNLVESGKETESFFSPDEETRTSSILSPAFFPTINALVTRAEKPGSQNSAVRTNCYEAISTVVDAGCVADQAVLMALLVDALGRLQSSLNRLSQASTHADRASEIALQEHVTGLATEILLNLGKAALPHADAAISTMLQELDARQASEEAWRAISCIMEHLPTTSDGSSALGASIARYVPAVWPRLIAALSQPADMTTCKAAIIASSSMVNSMESTLTNEQAASLLSALISLLRSNDVERELKPPALAALGDVSRALGQQVQPFLPLMHAVVEGAANLAVPENNNDDELAEYVGEVHDTCIDAWNGMVSAFMSEQTDARAVAAQQQAATQVLMAVPSPTGDKPTNAVNSMLRTLTKWVTAWCKSEAINPAHFQSNLPGSDLGNLIKKVVGLLGDIGFAVGPNAMASMQINSRTDWVSWILQKCEAVERAEAKENDEKFEVQDSILGFALKHLPA